MKYRNTFLMSRFALFILLISTVASYQLTSQENKYGIYANYGLNMHSADFRALPGVPNCCPNFETGEGLGLSLGALFEMDMTTNLYLSARLGYTDLSGELSSTEPTTIIVNNTDVDGEFTHTVNSDIQAVTARIMAGYRLLPNLSISAGLGVGNVINATYDQVETITKPSDSGTFIGENGFDTGSRTRNESDGDIPDQNSMRLFIATGIGYELPLNSDNSIRLMPEVNYNFAFSNVVNSVDWTINELKGGIAIKYVPQEGSDWQIIRDTIIVRDTTEQIVSANPQVLLIDTKVKEEERTEGDKKFIMTTINQEYIKQILDPNSIADASTSEWLSKFNSQNFTIYAKGIDYDGRLTPVATMRVEEFISDVIHPLLPYVFFESNSSEIPNRYTQNETLEEFTENKLIDDETLEVYYNLLNIVGKRMIDNPQAKLKLVGTNSNTGTEKGNTELSQNRADEVKQYLVNSWGIDSNRISTEARNLPENASNTKVEDGIAENKRVEIYSSDDAILDVVKAKDTLRKADPPSLRFVTSYTGTAKYSSWKVVVSQNGKKLKEFTGDGPIPGYIDWNLEQEQTSVPRFDSPLDYKLVVMKDGESAEVSSQLPMNMIKLSEKLVNKVDDKRIDKFNLILFDFNSAEISGRNEEIIGLIKSRIEDSSTIRIKGYTDRMGDEQLNENLSEKRAASASNALNNANAKSKGYGEKIELYNNDLPEGRMYNRTVEIIVETPLKK